MASAHAKKQAIPPGGGMVKHDTQQPIYSKSMKPNTIKQFSTGAENRCQFVLGGKSVSVRFAKKNGTDIAPRSSEKENQSIVKPFIE
jgi:hypothetical protein